MTDKKNIGDKKNLIETAAQTGKLNTFERAVKATGLDDALKGQGPFTIFAPTDEAFAKLPQQTLNDLLKPENKERLTSILKYHVVQGRVMSKEAENLKTAQTAQGQELRIETKDGVKVNDSKVVKPDFEASNGVIHLIDGVLMPQASASAK